MVSFNDIPNSIMLANNQYEQQRGIKTHTVSLIRGGEEDLWGIFEAEKSDNTNTLFFAYKHKRAPFNKWIWMCPAKDHINGFDVFIQTYWNNEEKNNSARGKPNNPITILQKNASKLTDFIKKRCG